jgi:protein SCO1
MGAMLALVAATLFGVVPIHGLVVANLPDRTVIVRTDPVTGTMPALTRRYRFRPAAKLPVGTTVDAFFDAGDPGSLHDVVPAAAFAPGLPDTGRVETVRVGSTLPPATLVDQNGQLLRLDRAFQGRTLLLSFVFTRCPDRTLCPAISGKFADLNARLDGTRFALAELTLDPQYDSPAVLRAYGGQFGARAPKWRLLTGTGSTITRLLDEFSISSMRVSSDNFLHSDRLFIVTPAGRIAYVVETGNWDPSSVLAQARAVSGLASNPFERFKLALVADVIALCGGTQSGGIVLLELTLFTLLTIASFAGMWAVGRVLWGRHKRSKEA